MPVYTSGKFTRYTNDDGKKHRTDGPAVIFDGEFEKWYKNGRLHRIDGPAVIFYGGFTAWYKNGKRHRIGGPAIIGNDFEAWLINGKRHRIDGPSFISENETIWFYNDCYVHPDAAPYLNKPGWRVNGVNHYIECDSYDDYFIEADEPTRVHFDGTFCHEIYGELWRYENKPSIYNSNGYMLWVLNNVEHRQNGPSCCDPSGFNEFHINGEKLTEMEYYRIPEGDREYIT